MAETIVFGSMGFAAAFVLVWLLRPEIRAWLEQPKHQFQDATRRYDRDARSGQIQDRRSREFRDPI